MIKRKAGKNRKETVYVGRCMTNGEIRIKNQENGKLISGQKVIIYTPTEVNIINKASGRKMGNKGTVLGTGIIHLENGAVIVSRDFPQKRCSSCTKKSRRLNDRRQVRIPKTTQVQTKYKVEDSNSKKVYVKLIEE